MSFVRVGRPQQHNKGKRPPVRPKKAAAPKRDWVNTVNDLSVHKLTPAELRHRHEIHKSHNKAAAQWELREKALKQRFKHLGSPAPLDQASLSIIREVFSDQLLLQDVLARSDRAMAVVKDLFGDAPRRQTGHPTVTMAPNCDSESELPVLQRPDPPTQLALLSQTMMDQQALNELQSSEEDHSDEDSHPPVYHVMQRANVRKTKSRPVVRGKQQQKVHRPISDPGDRESVPSTPYTSGSAPDQTALNATMAVQRVRSSQSQQEEAKEEPSALVTQVLNPDLPLHKSGRISSRTGRARKCISQSSELNGSSVSSLSGDQSSLALLQDMLGQVEADLDTLSPDTGPRSAQSTQQHTTQGLTGFSVSLISTLGRLVHLVKQRDKKVQNEAQERRKLEEQLREQQGLIDALTAEAMALREEAAALQAGLQQRTSDLEQKLDTVVLLIGGLGLLEAPAEPQNCDVRATAAPERLQAHVSPAALHSPPPQTDDWHHSPATYPLPLYQPFLPVDDIRSRKDVRAQSSAPSLASLPLTSFPSTSLPSQTTDPLSSQLPPEAMMAEIAQLSRQNDLIRAQLNQAKSVRSSEGGMTNSSSEQRRLSSSSAGKITPESTRERRTMVSSSSQSLSQNIPVSNGHKVARQTSPSTLSQSSVEQRLLELNRQSAAARGRLLELIEQQKLTVSSKVSPSVSPIPTSALSPQSAGGSPELLLPAREPLSQAGGERQYAASDVSSHRSEGGTREQRTQMEKQRERDGWFALSTHVR